jgi:hypothetical protein
MTRALDGLRWRASWRLSLVHLYYLRIVHVRSEQDPVGPQWIACFVGFLWHLPP